MPQKLNSDFINANNQTSPLDCNQLQVTYSAIDNASLPQLHVMYSVALHVIVFDQLVTAAQRTISDELL